MLSAMNIHQYLVANRLTHLLYVAVFSIILVHSISPLTSCIITVRYNVRSGMYDDLARYNNIYLQAGELSYTFGNPQQVVECASTIKLPILLMTCEKNQHDNDQLGLMLQRKPHHTSNGSGVLAWIDEPNALYTVRMLCYYMMVYSDCLATNILIEYIGGKSAINYWLKQHHLSTKLSMKYINFDTSNTSFQSVGKTTAHDLQTLANMVLTNDLAAPYQRLIQVCTSKLESSWVGEKHYHRLPGVHAKTGSMINHGPRGQTVINMSGYFTTQSGKSITFGLTAGGKGASKQSASRLKNHILDQFIDIADKAAGGL